MRWCTPIFLIVLFASISLAELPTGRQPPAVVLEGECGGRLDKTPWSSAELTGKVLSLYYVDPDESDMNEPLFERIRKENFPDEKAGSVAIINMKATWLPKVIVSAMLKKKQARFNRTVYVKDNRGTLVKAWNLADHSSDVVLIDKDGTVVFSKDGKFSERDIERMVELMRNLTR